MKLTSNSKSSFFLYLVAIFFPITLNAQSGGIDSFIHREMKERRIPGLQLAVVKQGKIIELKSYGIAEVSNQVPVTDQSIFAINSCTKAFTGVAVMQLVEEGKLNLDHPISNYIEELPEDWRKVTIKQLLTHVSGLPDIARISGKSIDLPPGMSKDEYCWSKVKTLPMDFKTGEQFRYNQTNYTLLGMVITKLSGKPFIDFFKERQFQPANMTRTLFADSRDVVPGWAPTYRYISSVDGVNLKEERLAPFYNEFIPSHRTASGLNSTAKEVASWLIALQNGSFFKSPSTLDALWTAGKYNDGSPTQWANGWVTKPRPKHKAIIATGGGRSAFFVYPDDKLAVVVLTNLSGSSPEDMIDEIAGFYNPDIPLADPITALRMQLRKQGYDQAIPVYQQLKKNNPDFMPLEVDLNDWGYRLLAKHPDRAVELFKLNVALYPASWNVYDSFGEGLFKTGQKEKAIQMYKKSIELNPDNRGGKEVLEMLMK